MEPWAWIVLAVVVGLFLITCTVVGILMLIVMIGPNEPYDLVPDDETW